MQITFSKHKGSILSRMIMWATNSNFSHASIRFGRTETNWMVEAARKGVQPGWWNTWKKVNEVVHTYEFVNLDEDILEKIVDECLDEMVGKSYDVIGVIGLGIVILLRKLGFKNIKNIFGSKKLYFCSEFCMKIGIKVQERFGIVIFTGDPELTSPYDLFLQCANNKYFVDKTIGSENAL